MHRTGWMAAALLASGCAREPGPSAAYVRVLDRAAEGSAPVRAETEPLFAADELILTGGAGDLRCIPLAKIQPLLFEATVSLAAEGKGAGLALTLAELRAPADDPEEAATLARRVLFERFIKQPGEERVSRVVLPASDTTTLGFLARPHGPGESAPRAVLRDVRLIAADALALLRDSPAALDVEAAPGRPATGRFALGGVSRPALALLDDGEVALPVSVPAGGARLALELALFPLPALAAGREVEVVVEVEQAGARTELVRWRGAAGPPKEARWTRGEGAAPLAAGEARLIFRARGAEAAGVVALAGAPRLVPVRRAPGGLNVVVVSIDTLRADRAGFLGAEHDTTPELDQLARAGLVLEHAWSQCSYTLPSHVSLLSGQFPSVHGVVDPARRVSAERTRLLAELLAERGYATAAFTGGGLVDPRFGFARGFDRYGAVDPIANLESERVRRNFADSEELDLALARAEQMDAAVAWVRDHAEGPFFLFLHTYAAHELDPPARHLAALGYPPAGAGDDAARALRALGAPLPETAEARDAVARFAQLYDGAVRQADEGVGRLVAGLRELGLFERTVLVVTSDHGEELGEHGCLGHGHSLHGELLRVPLLFCAPGVRPGRSAAPAMLVDVVPTILARLGLPQPPGVGGRDLLGPGGTRPLYAEIDALVSQRALLEGGVKTIHAPAGAATLLPSGPLDQSFDLSLDPGERSPLPPDPARVERVQAFRAELLRAGAALGAAPGDLDLDEGLVERLRALGYADLPRPR